MRKTIRKTLRKIKINKFNCDNDVSKYFIISAYIIYLIEGGGEVGMIVVL